MMRRRHDEEPEHERPPPSVPNETPEDRLDRVFDGRPPAAPPTKRAPACASCGGRLVDHCASPSCLWLRCARPQCGAVLDLERERWIAGKEPCS